MEWRCSLDKVKAIAQVAQNGVVSEPTARLQWTQRAAQKDTPAVTALAQTAGEESSWSRTIDGAVYTKQFFIGDSHCQLLKVQILFALSFYHFVRTDFLHELPPVIHGRVTLAANLRPITPRASRTPA